MLDKQLHEKHIIKILNSIFKSDFSNALAFKGGTLIYLKYGLNRFSTDIDLDLIDKSSE